VAKVADKDLEPEYRPSMWALANRGLGVHLKW
jgi:hypothetical protein